LFSFAFITHLQQQINPTASKDQLAVV